MEKARLTYLSFATDQRHTVVLGNLVCLENLDSCTQLDGRTSVGTCVELLVKFVVLEMVGPDVESAHAS